jgi:hypothetical protein
MSLDGRKSSVISALPGDLGAPVCRVRQHRQERGALKSNNIITIVNFVFFFITLALNMCYENIFQVAMEKKSRLYILYSDIN